MRSESELDLDLLSLRGIGDIVLFLERPDLLLDVLIDDLGNASLLGGLAAFNLQLALLQEVSALRVCGRLLNLQPQLPDQVLDVVDLLSQ